jgi:hypothetical protein
MCMLVELRARLFIQGPSGAGEIIGWSQSRPSASWPLVRPNDELERGKVRSEDEVQARDDHVAVDRFADRGAGLLQRADQDKGVRPRKSAPVLDISLAKPWWA